MTAFEPFGYLIGIGRIDILELVLHAAEPLGNHHVGHEFQLGRCVVGLGPRITELAEVLLGPLQRHRDIRVARIVAFGQKVVTDHAVAVVEFPLHIHIPNRRGIPRTIHDLADRTGIGDASTPASRPVER